MTTVLEFFATHDATNPASYIDYAQFCADNDLQPADEGCFTALITPAPITTAQTKRAIYLPSDATQRTVMLAFLEGHRQPSYASYSAFCTQHDRQAVSERTFTAALVIRQRSAAHGRDDRLSKGAANSIQPARKHTTHKQPSK